MRQNTKPNAWERFWDRVFYNKKARNAWNRYVCPAIEVVGYGLMGLLIAASIYITAVMLVLVAN